MANQQVKEAKADAKAEKAKAKAMRPWYSKKRFIIPMVLLALIFLTAVASDSDESSSNNQASTSQQQSDEDGDDDTTVASLGDPVRDGSFEFIVNGLECGVQSVGDQFLNETAQGQYCLLDVTVENIGNEAKMLSASDQYLYDSQDRRFSADSTATLYHNDDSTSFFLNNINPGNSVSGQIIFDVPEGADIVRAELHDSVFSGGIEVAL